MYKQIQEAILKGDYLAAAQLCQQGLDATPAPTTTLAAYMPWNLVYELEGRTLDGSLDKRLWELIQDRDPLVKDYLRYLPDADLIAAISDTYAILKNADDSDLWEAMSSAAQRTKAREYYADNIDVDALRRLCDALEG